MKKLVRFIFWGVVFVVLLVAADQALLRVDLDVPGYREAHSFYKEFRARLIGLGGEQTAPPASGNEGTQPAPPAAGPSYVYVDDEGALHFAENLNEVPERYRQNAQQLGH
ncbi:hypothetical protein [Geoalkalibacter subterraneus]|uniref:DUF4124 domain-containing protein n=1 Tax=Geoalkalibacter subterraneus TaxID=483547 RepID=A0A0B5FKY9_9BACT|nr:hypothetical protein [Geoalkalibacter subterraneus]AJF05339.1 hypothetical protein GSUB_00350 [Geoalkalibacter subterraneus]